MRILDSTFTMLEVLNLADKYTDIRPYDADGDNDGSVITVLFATDWTIKRGDELKQQVALQSLLSRGPGSATADQLKFLTETTFNKRGEYKLQDFSGTPEFQKKIRRSNAAYIAAELKQKGSGEFAKDVIPLEKLTNVGAELNAIQKEALGIRDTGNIRSKDYANLLQ